MWIEYPNSRRILIPFFENPVISENKRANYVSYKLLGRAENLFSYTGADSRELDLEFNLTADHIAAEAGSPAQYIQKINALETSTEAEKDKFKEYRGAPTGDLSAKHTGRSRQLWENYKGLTNSLQSPVNEGKAKYQDLIKYWVEIIRSTTHNNAKNPAQGPPIVRLTHGTLYRAIPCICDSYSIDIVEDAGYQMQTLHPRVIKIRMRLKETRAGNFGAFEPSKSPQRDNLAGWEQLVDKTADSTGTMDPHTLGFTPADLVVGESLTNDIRGAYDPTNIQIPKF